MLRDFDFNSCFPCYCKWLHITDKLIWLGKSSHFQTHRQKLWQPGCDNFLCLAIIQLSLSDIFVKSMILGSLLTRCFPAPEIRTLISLYSYRRLRNFIKHSLQAYMSGWVTEDISIPGDLALLDLVGDGLPEHGRHPHRVHAQEAEQDRSSSHR